MIHPRSQAFLRLTSLGAALGAVTILSACVVQPLPAPRYFPPPRPVAVIEQPAPVQDEAVVSVYVDPPLVQPAPIAVQWAPPPMLVEVPPPQPYGEAIWTGGYWAWEGRWFWSAGRWAPPPQPNYGWVQPYYEHRGDVVVFVPGFWCAPQVRFVPPPVGVNITLAIAAPGVRFGVAAIGPQGVFVPPPPGSRAGIIVPAPLGTPPAVVVSAPAVINVGMRVRGNVDINSHNTTTNVTNITNVTNVTVEAPVGATANGQAFQNSVPASAHLAAAMAPAGRPAAPRPVLAQAIPTYQSGQQPTALPTAQPVRPAPVNGGARPALQQPQGQQAAPQGPQPGARPAEGQGRTEFDASPRQPAQINGQPQAGQPQAQGQGQKPGQPQPANLQDPRAHGRGGNPQGQPDAKPTRQPRPQPGGQPPGQRQPPQAAKPKEPKEPKEVKETNEKPDRHKAERARQEENDKAHGERDR